MRNRHLRKLFLLEANPVIRFLVLSDVLILGASNLLTPVFALFVVGHISGANAGTVGFAIALSYLIKSLTQIPAATYFDKVRGEKDEFWAMFYGSILLAVLHLLFLAVNTNLELFLLMACLGVVNGLIYPPYLSMFTKHVDHREAALEWSVKMTGSDISMSLAAFIGGIVAVSLGYEVLIILVAAFSFLGALALWPVRRHILVEER